jgi:hypothetical protein
MGQAGFRHVPPPSLDLGGRLPQGLRPRRPPRPFSRRPLDPPSCLRRRSCRMHEGSPLLGREMPSLGQRHPTVSGDVTMLVRSWCGALPFTPSHRTRGFPIISKPKTPISPFQALQPGTPERVISFPTHVLGKVLRVGGPEVAEADARTRTGNLLLTRQLLYQLSYVSGRYPGTCSPRRTSSRKIGSRRPGFNPFALGGRFNGTPPSFR